MVAKFPSLPDDLFEGFDWGYFDEEMKNKQVALLGALTDKQLNDLGQMVVDYDVRASRRRRILAVASFLGRVGVALVPVI